ncbi:D-methionine ABC transporter permease [Bordetella ansorpii]|uniref:D-methionine ABC transporter permease n=1 Tax=Bordetella ansorpii TaxID=288768 RepID=A0A157Q5N4_9BORD|nr:methionine ABC transporter permease [Bordetella ansorpii]SAI41067.1 D-methionine ABC transporter permease [Bordetella ansorpii]
MGNRDWKQYLPDFWEALGQTLYMTSLAGVFVITLGIATGLLLYLSAPGSWRPRPVLYHAVNTVVNTGRSIPFIILIVILIPVTRMVIGTPLGPAAALVPLTIGFTPFFSRLIEANLRELDQGRIDAARAIGVTTPQFIFRILLPESLSGIIGSATIILVGLVEGTAVAGAIGAGGVGDFAMTFGYQRWFTELIVIAVVAMVAIVQFIQISGDAWIRLRRHKR